MSIKHSVWVLIFAMACALAAAPAVKKKPAPKPARKTAAGKPAAGRSTAKKAAAKKTATRRSASRRRPTRTTRAASWRNTQRTPTVERYREIQQALADKGYLERGAPDGDWDAASIAALKKFQQDQSLEPSGKIDSLSLIALGLGPRRDQASSQPLPPVPQP